MAKETVVRLIDDLDGSEAAQTVTFALDGTAYEIDLSEANADELREAMAPYVNAARISRATLVNGGRGRGRPRAVRSYRSPSSNVSNIREWARSAGYQISDRGRISREVLQAYEAAAS